MMGERDPQTPLWNYRVNLDKRVRSDHPLRRINAVLDLSFVRQAVAHTYGRRGNKSVREILLVGPYGVLGAAAANAAWPITTAARRPPPAHRASTALRHINAERLCIERLAKQKLSEDVELSGHDSDADFLNPLSSASEPPGVFQDLD